MSDHDKFITFNNSMVVCIICCNGLGSFALWDCEIAMLCGVNLIQD